MLKENHLHETEPKWFAVRTRSKAEKVVKAQFLQKGIETYLPLLKVTRRYTRKVKQLELPLINAYVFVRINKQHYLPVLKTEHVVDLLRFSGNLISIPESEIELMKRVVGENYSLLVEPVSFEEGDWVEVIAGQLTGLQGKLIRKQGKSTFLVDLKTIGYSLHIQIPEAYLRKLPGNAERIAQRQNA